MSLEGIGPSLTVEGATTSRVFETYVEKVLAPSLKEGQVVVMDNLSAHKPKRIRELIEQRGCELVYLCPPTLRTTTPLRKLSPRSRTCCAQGSSQEQRGSDRCDSNGAKCDQCRRHPRLLSTCGIPSCGSTTVKRAVVLRSSKAYLCVPPLRNGALERFSRQLMGQWVTTVRKPAQSVSTTDRIERLPYRFHQCLLRASLNPA